MKSVSMPIKVLQAFSDAARAFMREKSKRGLSNEDTRSLLSSFMEDYDMEELGDILEEPVRGFGDEDEGEDE